MLGDVPVADDETTAARGDPALRQAQHAEPAPAGGREDGVLGFTVLDDGVGISPEVAARATEPFFTTKSTAGGAGLGLAIVNEIVANHGGRLFISPRSPRGTSARMEIPIERRGVRHG